MEGTHTSHQLHKPIKELCYVSLYFPRGKVRGFTYKGSTTLHRKCSAKSFKEKEESGIVKQKDQSCETITDLCKQTTTQGILIELYKLTAEQERLLANLLTLCSDCILSVKMGNQDGKLQDVSLKGEFESDVQNIPQLVSLLTDKKTASKSRKLRKLGKRRENTEESLQNKIKRKMHCGLEASSVLIAKEVAIGKDKMMSAKLSISGSPRTPLPVAESFNLPTEQRSGSPPKNWDAFEKCTTLGSDTDLYSSISDYGDESDAEYFKSRSTALLDDVEDTTELLPEQKDGLLHGNVRADNLFDKTMAFNEPIKNEAKDLRPYCHDDEADNEETVTQVVARMQDAGAVVQKVITAYAEPDVNIRHKDDGENVFLTKHDVLAVPVPELESNTGLVQEKEESDYSVLQHGKEAEQSGDESCSLGGLVNKNLLKVIQSDNFDETAELKRLTKKQLELKSLETTFEDRGRLQSQLEKTKSALLNLPLQLSHDTCQVNACTKSEAKSPSSPSLVAIGNAFNNSYPVTNAHPRMSPIPSPLSSKLPSPQLNHRILLLP
uniref:Formin 1 n=1 Tax=Latimeria chalumnae TaxID=7897 RepID=H3B1U0_LATCH